MDSTKLRVCDQVMGMETRADDKASDRECAVELTLTCVESNQQPDAHVKENKRVCGRDLLFACSADSARSA